MKRMMILVFVILLITACNINPGTATPAALTGGPRAWIDAPLDGTQRPLAPLEIVSHTSDLSIAQVELSVNGAVVRSDPNPNRAELLVTTRQTWTPPGAGNYTLQVRAQSTAGVWGDYAKALVTITGGGVVQGKVYTDLNGNGVIDVGETPLEGVVVALSGCASRTATTPTDGAFQFTGLPTGTCQVAVTKSGWKYSGTYLAGSGYPVRAASDPTKPTTFYILMTPVITPTPTSTPAPAASGVVQGKVYTDLNGNGVPDVGDMPLEGVVVTLSGCASRTATTPADGMFQFTGLPTGTCLVAATKSGWKFSGINLAGAGYPVQAASDPSKPTAFQILMAPLATIAPTPTLTRLPPVSITFYADQPTLVAGQCTTIHWQVTNASQVFMDNASVAASGSKQDCPTSQYTTHTLRVVTLDNQTVQRSLTITVVPAPIITITPLPPPPPAGCRGTPNIGYFTASPSTTTGFGSITLSWGAVTNADWVEIDHRIGTVATPGSTTVPAPNATTTYTLTAHCGSNTATGQVTVTLTRPIGR